MTIISVVFQATVSLDEFNLVDCDWTFFDRFDGKLGHCLFGSLGRVKVREVESSVVRVFS